MKLHGSIGNSSNGVNLKNHGDLLLKAFANKRTHSVIIHLNSPGGSPGVSYEIASLIKKLKNQYNKPCYCYVEEIAASGGYFIACAADSIVTNPYAVVGSIGVISGSFGFVDLIKKLGIQRRVYTSGENKNKLDPFSEEKPQDVEKFKKLLEDTHANFIHWVETNRPRQIHKDFFNGDFWGAEQAHQIGFVDTVLSFSEFIDVLDRDQKYRINTIELKRGMYSRLINTALEITVDKIFGNFHFKF